MIKDSSNGIEPIGAPIIQKPMLGVRKFGGSDMDEFNPCGNQPTHFTN